MVMAFTTAETKYLSPDTTLLGDPQVNLILKPKIQSMSISSDVNPILSLHSLKQSTLIVNWNTFKDPNNPRK